MIIQSRMMEVEDSKNVRQKVINKYDSIQNHKMSNSQVFNLDELTTNQYEFLGYNHNKNNIHQLTYTIVAGTAVCMRLKIQASAYRLLKSADDPKQQQSCLVLVRRAENFATNRIAGSFGLLKKYGSKITLTRLNLGVVNINNLVLPQLPVASELYVYLHTNSVFNEIVKQIVSNQTFVVSTKLQQIYINMSWLKNKQFLTKIGPDSYLQCRRQIAQNQTSNLTNYLHLSIKAVSQHKQDQKYNSCVFMPNKSKLVLQKADHYDLNEITKIIKLPAIYSKIYQLQPYVKLKDRLVKEVQDRPQKNMIILKVVDDVGIGSFLHYFGQQHQYAFVQIDCQYFVGSNQLLQKIKNSQCYPSTIVHINNIQWLLQVGNQKNDQQQKMKRLLHSLEQTFYNLGDQSLTSHILIVSFKGTTIKFDMTKNAHLIQFQMNKQHKMDTLVKILEYCKKEQKIDVENVEEIVGLASSGLGWVKFLEILRKLKNKIGKQGGKLKTQAIISQIGKVANMEKVQNIKKVTWDDVGGLQNAKQQIIQTILLPTKHPEIFDEWIKPRTGLLFFGPPGTGKTLLGKCIANQCKMGFISVKGPQLLNMYIGQSEKNVREVFQRAAASRPCIVFMDQLDALIPKRGQSSDSNQVMDRIVSELLTQMDKAPSRGIFVIGATNRPDLLDPSILRPGRFDKQIYLGITKQKQARIQILKAQTRHIKLSENFNYEKVIESVPQNFTGADFYGLTSKSITLAAQKFIDQYDKKQKNEDDEVTVAEQDFIQTAKTMKPSVSLEQLARYEKLKEQYK